MQKESKGFLANGGLLLLIGVALALISVLVSAASIYGNVDVFKLVTGEAASFHLGHFSDLFALAYVFFAVGLIAVGSYRLMEHAHTASTDKRGSGTSPTDSSGLHPVS